MPICIECRYPVSQLYHVSHSSKHKPATSTTSPNLNPNATTKSPTAPSTPGTTNSPTPGPKQATATPSKGSFGGRDVRLTQCPRCKRFADKYVEHDNVVLFIDLVLVKPQVYRHLLFNRLARLDDEFDPSITKLGTLLLLFDVYITWSSIEALPSTSTSNFPIPHFHILLQYAFYLTYCALTTSAQHLGIRWAARWIPASLNNTAGGTAAGQQQPQYQQQEQEKEKEKEKEKVGGAGAGGGPNAISTALFVSSCMKLFPILMVVWRYDDVGGQVGRGVEWAVAVQNLEALRILLGCSYLVAGMLVGIGVLCRWVVGRVILGAVGLREVGGLMGEG